MDIDDIVIKVQVAADGVKQGVDSAIAQFKKLEDYKNSITEELKLQISVLGTEEAMDAIDALHDLGKLTIEEEIAGYQEILKAYTVTAEEKLEIDKRLYALRKKLAKEEMEEIEKMGTGRAETTDYAAQINELTLLQKKYVDDKLIVDEIGEEIAKKEIDRNKKITDNRIKGLNQEVDGINREIELSKKRNGIYNDGVMHVHSIEKEIAYSNEKLRILDEEINYYKEKGIERTDYESRTLSLLLSEQQKYYDEIKNLEIENQKNRSDKKKQEYERSKKEVLSEVKDYYDEQTKIEQDALENELDSFRKSQDIKKAEIDSWYKRELEIIRGQKDLLKEEYDQRIEIIKNAVNSEIDEYKRRIDKIDELLKHQVSADKDSKELKNIEIIKAKISYEKDESNIFQLEKELVKAQAELKKRKEREELETEKGHLQEKIKSVRDNEVKQIDILNESKAQALKIHEEEAKARKEELELSRNNAIAVLEEETKTAVLHFGKRGEDVAQFYKNKYEIAVENANNEKVLMHKTQNEMYLFLVSDEVSENYRNAGETHGKAYSDKFNGYLDGIAKKLESLAIRTENMNSKGSNSRGKSSFDSLFNAKDLATNAVENIRNFSTNFSSDDNRSATINQTFNVQSGEVSPYVAKKAAKDSLKLALR